MKFQSILAGASLLATAIAAPVGNANGTQAKGSGITDLDILQFALSLELLEITLYDQGSARFSSQDFQNAGLAATFKPRLEEIITHEISHIATIRAAIKMLGGTPVGPAEYSFPYTDAASFVNLTDVVNGLGPSAYVGAGGYITDKLIGVTGAAIGNTETRHNSWLNGEIGRDETPVFYQVPLTPTQSYGVASQFIVGNAPKLNAVQAYPAPLKVLNPGYPLKPLTPGASVSLQPGSGYKGGATGAAFLYNLNTTIVPFDGSSATIPADFGGQGYVVLTTAKEGQGLTIDNSLTVPAGLFVDIPASKYAGYNYQEKTY